MKLLDRKSSVGRDAIYLTVSRIVVSVIGLITSMLLSRFRTLEEYGTYSQIIMVTDLVSTILMLGLPNSINYFLAKSETEGEKQRFMSIYVTLSTILTAIIALSLLGTVPMITRYFNNSAITAFTYVFAIYPWSSLIINSLGNTCVVYEKTNRLILFNVVYAVSSLLILLFTKAVRMSFQQYMMFYMGAMMGFALFALGWISKMVGVIRPLLSRTIIKEVLVFSIPLGLASVVGTLNAELDKLVIGKFFTTQEYAVFANAAKELPVTILATSLTAVLMPRFVRLLGRGENEKAVEMWGCAAKLSFCFMTLVVGGFIVFAPDIMSLFYSEKYVTSGGVMVFRIYAFILMYRAIYWGIILNATGQTRFVFYSSVITLALNFVGNIISCYTIGFIGPAVSSLLVTAIMALIQLGFSCRIIHIQFNKILPWRTIAGYVAETALLACIFSIVRYGMIDGVKRSVSIVISIILGTVWAILYAWINRKDLATNWRKLNSITYK